jgi:Recombination endonuclease VII
VGKQNGVCAICLTNPDGKLFVDHDHDRKSIRELLCNLCNVGLGSFKDRPSLLEAAAAYLRKHGRKG